MQTQTQMIVKRLFSFLWWSGQPTGVDHFYHRHADRGMVLISREKEKHVEKDPMRTYPLEAQRNVSPRWNVSVFLSQD